MKMQIYIVEDNPLDLKITSRAVESIGFSVSGHSLSGEDALEQIAARCPDIVLMDIFLRGEMDGIETADRIVQAYDIPVIFLTAHSEMELLLRASESHSFGYVLKPFDVNALHAMIRMALSRHRLAQRLKESELFSRTIVNNIQAGVILFDAEKKIIRINFAACRILGRSEKELYGKNAGEWPDRFYYSDGSPMPEERYPVNRVYAENKAVKDIIAGFYRQSDQIMHWILIHAVPVLSHDGSLKQVLTTFTDITGRKQAEDALYREREFLNAVLENIGDGIVACNAQGKLTLFNQASRRYHGLPEKTLPPEKWAQYYDLYLSDGKTPMKTENIPLFRAFQGEHVRNSEMVIVPGQGKRRSLVANGRPIFDENGRKFGAVVSMHDITDLKETEEELRRHREELEKLVEQRTGELAVANARLQEERDVAQKYLDIAGVIILVLDLQGNIRLMNKKGCELLEICEENIIGLSWTEEFIPKDMQSGILQIFENIIRDNSDTHHYNENYVISRKGEKRLIAWHNITLRDAENRITGVLSSGEDITERRQTEALLEKRQAELERSNRELDDFAYIASHDLREPLRGIRNYAKFLLQDYSGRLDADGENKLETLVFLAQRLDGLIESLLWYSRLGRQNPAIRESDLNEILKGVLDVLRLSIEESQTEIRVPQPLPVMICDPLRVHEIFFNLISNALRYNDKSEKWVEITHKKDEKGKTVFCIRDNGIGIREKHLDIIFRIFKRLHGRDRYGGGYGFGLTIVQKIIENHGGKIWVSSEFGKGTAFYFTLEKGE